MKMLKSGKKERKKTCGNRKERRENLIERYVSNNKESISQSNFERPENWKQANSNK